MTETSGDFDVFISYRRDGGASEARLIQAKLIQENLRVFLDVDSLRPGHFDQALLKRIGETPNFMVVLSPCCLDRCIQEKQDWLRQEIAQAVRTNRNIIPIMMPGFKFPIPKELPEDIRVLGKHQSISYSHEFFGAMMEKVIQYLQYGSELQNGAALPVRPNKGSAAQQITKLASVKTEAPAKKDVYVVRREDEYFDKAIERRDSIILIKGNRQMGKTLLLTRGLQRAKATEARVVFTDLQKFNSSSFETVENLYMALGDSIADQLDLDVSPFDKWIPNRSPYLNFDRYLRREVLNKIQEHIVWGLDEVDRLFSYPFYSEVFGLFRSWHNGRYLDPDLNWFTLAIAYTSGDHLFIADSNQSPFNVGTRLEVGDFTLTEIAELNRQFGEPLKSAEELQRFYHLVSGHPFLVRRGLRKLTNEGINLAALESYADQEDGPFGNHLEFTVALLERDPHLCNMVKDMLMGRSSLTREGFNRLEVAGILAGDSIGNARIRCQLYASYFKRKLLSPAPNNSFNPTPRQHPSNDTSSGED